MFSVVSSPSLPLHLLVHNSKIFQSPKAAAGLINFAVAILDRSRLMSRSEYLSQIKPFATRKIQLWLEGSGFQSSHERRIRGRKQIVC